MAHEDERLRGGLVRREPESGDDFFGGLPAAVEGKRRASAQREQRLVGEDEVGLFAAAVLHGQGIERRKVERARGSATSRRASNRASLISFLDAGRT